MNFLKSVKSKLALAAGLLLSVATGFSQDRTVEVDGELYHEKDFAQFDVSSKSDKGEVINLSIMFGPSATDIDSLAVAKNMTFDEVKADFNQKLVTKLSESFAETIKDFSETHDLLEHMKEHQLNPQINRDDCLFKVFAQQSQTSMRNIFDELEKSEGVSVIISNPEIRFGIDRP